MPLLIRSAGDVALVALRLVKCGKGPNEDQEEDNSADEARFAVSLPMFEPNHISVRICTYASRLVEAGRSDEEAIARP